MACTSQEWLDHPGSVGRPVGDAAVKILGPSGAELPIGEDGDASLAEAGIDYVHLQRLGTPKAGREAVRAGRPDEMRKIYDAHLEGPDAQLQLAEARDIAKQRTAALLCYEADPAHCHRRIVAERLCEEHAFEVEDLRP